MAITRSRVLQKIEIDTLFNKANHFLDKKSFEKEKEYVKKEIKHKYIAEGEFGRSYADKKFLKNGGDQKSKTHKSQAVEEEEDDDQYEDVEDEEEEVEEEEKETDNVRNKREHQRKLEEKEGKNQTYLKKYREKVESQ